MSGALPILERVRELVRREMGGGLVTALRPLTGGASSVTFLAELASGSHPASAIVIRSAPAGLAPAGNRDVLRQARLMKALMRGGSIPVPRVYFEDSGSPPGVPPLFAMEMVSGESFEPNKDPRESTEMPAPLEIRSRAETASRILAALHMIDPDVLGLSAEPATSLDAEVARWRNALARAHPAMADAADALGTRLMSRVPEPLPPRVCHGDFRLGNTLCERGRVLAVIDWEVWTLGDPRLDLAWFLLTADPAAHPLAIRQAPGMPRAEELLQVYESAGGSRLEHPHWFRALAFLKMSAAVAGIVKHQTKGGDSQGLACRLAPQIPTMIDRAHDALGQPQ